MSCQVLRCGRPGTPTSVPGGPASWALCDGHREAIAGGVPWSRHGGGSLVVGVDALYDLPRAVKRLQARVADSVQVVDGRRQGLVQLDLTYGFEGTPEHDRDLSLVVPAHLARALAEGLADLADDADTAA
ncbi:hypothetical protein ACI8AF_03855 [Blastococcus sp. SYSU D00669]